MTMANDFKGELKEFAVVIPVPTFLKREQIHVGEKSLVDHLDAYSAPRLVEYFDANPCELTRDVSRCRWRLPRRSRGAGHGRRQRGEEPRRDHRGAVHGRRVRHPDSLGATELGARNLAARERLPDSSRRVRGAVELSETEHAVLRREGQPDGTGQARLLVPAPAAGGVRVAEVHAADPARHGERERTAGAVRLRADAQGSRRNDELSHDAAAFRHGAAGLPEGSGGVFQVLQGDVHAPGRRRKTGARCFSSTRGT